MAEATSTTVSNLSITDIKTELQKICTYKDQISGVINIAKIFTGPTGDGVLDSVVNVLFSLCAMVEAGGTTF